MQEKISAHLDPFFVKLTGSLVQQIKTGQIIQVYLDDLVCIEHISTKSSHKWRPQKITASIPYKCLQGETKNYEKYIQKFEPPYRNLERFYKLKKSIEDNGYPHNNEMIVVFGNEPYIRDGQSRAAILRYLNGNIEVSVLKLTFNKGLGRLY